MPKKKKTKDKQEKENKEVKKQEEQKPEIEASPELEEKTEEAEQEVRTLSFQNFIQTSSSQRSTPSLTPVSNLATETLDLSIDTGFESPTRDADEEKETTLEQYALPESSMKEYQEIVREQARMSSEVSQIRGQEIELETLGRERQAVGAEAGLINAEELMGMQGSGARGEGEYVMKPGKVGFEFTSEKTNLPFQETKKTYEEFE